MNFGVKSSIEEKVILAMMNKPAKPRCAGKTRAAEHSPPFRRIFEYSTSNVRLRFIKPESESLNIRQTRIQVPEVEYLICRSLVTRPKDLVEAIENMTGLRVSVLFRGEGIYIGPGVPHAVISINNSAISGWDYVDSNWIDDDTVRMRMGWEHDLMRDRKTQEVPFFESIGEISRLHRDQMDLWTQAKGHLPAKVRQIDNFLKTVENDLNKVLSDE